MKARCPICKTRVEVVSVRVGNGYYHAMPHHEAIAHRTRGQSLAVSCPAGSMSVRVVRKRKSGR